ncbi:MAG TPA: flagellar hook capping FlgD N-terminal domain-containing protein [Solirubrobacteraceae bacterium]|jgi:flagellar basal-body rod modification protein FlgD|nr:flagellar hook capping FlgD N-terminal domain-containing protein [Solirubrobacteraceae bacterium]
MTTTAISSAAVPSATVPTTTAPATTPTTSAASATSKTGAGTGASNATPENPNGELGKNDFLKLMVAQLQAQNPLEPTNDTEYIAELAQFSQLEQTTNIAQTSSQAAVSQQVAQAVGLIGHTVSYIDPTTGASTQGKVQTVEIGSAGPTLTVEGTAGIEPSSITEVS